MPIQHDRVKLGRFGDLAPVIILALILTDQLIIKSIDFSIDRDLFIRHIHAAHIRDGLRLFILGDGGWRVVQQRVIFQINDIADPDIVQ